MSATERSTSLTVGIVIAREKTDHAWQEFRWRPSELLIGVPELSVGDVISEADGIARFFAGTFEIELHRKETPAYIVNLENDPPSVYVVLGEADHDDVDRALPLTVEAVTVSPFEAQDYLDSGEDIVEPIAMSEPLIAWLERFVADHHVEETFIKRKRDKVDIHQEKFGQEPVHIVRQRQRRH